MPTTHSTTLWKRMPSIELLNKEHQHTIHASLGILFTQVGSDFLEATMPVSPKTHQFFGFLHGGASVVLAESLGSVASCYVTDDPVDVFGIEINASHLSSCKEGYVVGRASLLRKGNRILVWAISVYHQSTGAAICQSRLTTYITKARKNP